MRVLVVDDDPMYRCLLCDLLKPSPFEIVAAASGEEALAIAAAPNPPEIAILDWMMPGLDGFDLCRRIRAFGSDGLPYILLMTANTSRDDLLRVLVAGADDYLLKPFEALDLTLRVRTAARVVDLQQRLLQLQPLGGA